MTPGMLFDYLAVRLNPEKADGKDLTLNLRFTDLEQDYALTVKNSVLNYKAEAAEEPDVSLTISKADLDDIQLGLATLEEQVANGKLKIEGRQEAFSEFLGMPDTFEFWFEMVAP